jgi:methyl-accepting chemotaxis protein
MESKFETYFNVGKTMAQAYIDEGPAGGNQAMANFDEAAAEIAAQVDILLKIATDKSTANLSNQHKTIKQLNTYVIIASVSLVAILSYLFFVIHGVMDALPRISKVVGTIAEGDLSGEPFVCKHNNELGHLADGFNKMKVSLRSVLGNVSDTSSQLFRSVEQLTVVTQETEQSMDQQLNQINMVATAMNEMSATVHEVANNAASTAEATRNADKEANNGRAVVNQTIQSINALSSEMQEASSVIKQLEEDTESIGSVLDVIRGIAEQTNLLALNAAIEAARAGEQGRGFAVVADEVRTLASRTQDSTQEIQNMIEKLQQGSRNAVKVMDEGNQQTEKTVSQAAEAGATLQSITEAVDHITSMNEQIASAAEEQSSVAEEINRNVVNVRDIAENTVNNANQTAQSSAALKDVAAQLQSLVAEFKVN